MTLRELLKTTERKISSMAGEVSLTREYLFKQLFVSK